MPAQVLVTLPDSVYERVQQLAQVHQQEIAEAIAEYLETNLPSVEPTRQIPETRSTQKAALAREKAAYIRMHPMLKEKYFGQHVAIYQGELIDMDSDYGQLYERIRARYPNEIVWLATVTEEPIETIVVRSPRFVTKAA